MTLTIDEDNCARCGVCEPECPDEAIFQTEDAYVIDSVLCTGCMRYGVPLCRAVCPNNAIRNAKESLYRKCLGLFG